MWLTRQLRSRYCMLLPISKRKASRVICGKGLATLPILHTIILLLWSIIVFSSSPRKRIHTRYPTMQFTSICIGPNKQLQHHTSIVKKRAKPRALRTKIHGPLSATAKLLVLYHRTPLATLDRISVCDELSRWNYDSKNISRQWSECSPSPSPQCSLVPLPRRLELSQACVQPVP